MGVKHTRTHTYSHVGRSERSHVTPKDKIFLVQMEIRLLLSVFKGVRETSGASERPDACVQSESGIRAYQRQGLQHRKSLPVLEFQD